MIFGKIVRHARFEKKLTVRQFLDRLNLDLSPAYITKIEKHGEVPRPFIIYRIAEVLQLSPHPLWYIGKKNKLTLYEKKLDEEYDQFLDTLKKDANAAT